ncbi:sigma-70 family RNA polymerase sigma factor [Vibrio sp. TRT 21S02]|uniref:sigma-70 family RNA polymerase sigma factor n=1 Tax=Vibrio sp. TRT 21S02 TaxID=3418507 RepID=UPI003CED721E
MENKEPTNFSKADWIECMERVKSKDKHAFELIFRFFAPKLKSFAFKQLRNEQVAIELVQESLAIVWQKSHLFDGNKSALSTWIYTIVRNQCFDTLRKQKGSASLLLAQDIWPEDVSPPEMVELYTPEHDLMKEQVVKFLQTLPEAQRQVVEAVYLEELPHHAVAERFDIPVGTVKSRLRLAVEKLRHSIKVGQL